MLLLTGDEAGAAEGRKGLQRGAVTILSANFVAATRLSTPEATEPLLRGNQLGGARCCCMMTRAINLGYIDLLVGDCSMRIASIGWVL
jgi:hypothetical protein